MKLYHGTTYDNFLRILNDGAIAPRSFHYNTNFEIESNEQVVYLTNAYAAYFALGLSFKDNCDKAVILEVDTDLFESKDFFCPDEDAIEQVLRGKDGIDLPMEERTAIYRELITTRKYRSAWGDSLTALGNCGHYGPILLTRVTRVLVMDIKNLPPWLTINMMDPTITVLNYMICGQKYRDYTTWLFNPNHKPATRTNELVSEWPDSTLHRKGLHVVDMASLEYVIRDRKNIGYVKTAKQRGWTGTGTLARAMKFESYHEAKEVMKRLGKKWARQFVVEPIIQ